jgi:hypothetical protein
MAAIRISTVEPPLNDPALVMPAIRLVRRALGLGLLSEGGPVEQLSLELVRRIAREATTAGIGIDASASLLHGSLQANRLGASHLADLIERLEDSLAQSPLPSREVPELLRVFDREELSELIGTTPVSLGRYLSGSRAWPDELATRIHWLALVVSDLQGAYNDFGIRRWFNRVRPQLDGRSPRQTLGADWDPGNPTVERVRQLAASLVGAGAAT